MATPNQYESLARERKCKAICKVVIGDAANVLRIGMNDAKMWEALAHVAGVGIPSDESRRRIIEMVEASA